MIAYNVRVSWNGKQYTNWLMRRMVKGFKQGWGDYLGYVAIAITENTGSPEWYINDSGQLKRVWYTSKEDGEARPKRRDDVPFDEMHSEPGEIPFTADQTYYQYENLAASLHVVSDNKRPYSVLTTDDPAAWYLEKGTVWMEPRPFFMVILEDNKEAIFEAIVGVF